MPVNGMSSEDGAMLEDIFYDWHTDHYFWQCYHNLEEQYDCGLIEDVEWETMCDEFCLKL